MFVVFLTALIVLQELFHLATLLGQHTSPCFVLRKLLCPLSVLCFLLLVELASLFKLCAPGIQLACLVGQLPNFFLLGLHLFFILLLCLQQIVGGSLVILYLKQRVKYRFAIARPVQENSGKRSLRNTQCITKEGGQGTFTINPKEFMQLIQHICTLFSDTEIGLLIINKPARTGATAPLDGVGPIIVADKLNNDTSKLLSLAHKTRRVIRHVIKKGKANGLNQGRLPRAICPTNSGCAAPKVHNGVAITFDIL